jgi:hypothetical protein
MDAFQEWGGCVLVLISDVWHKATVSDIGEFQFLSTRFCIGIQKWIQM